MREQLVEPASEEVAVLSPEQQVEVLRECLDELLVAGAAVSAQLKARGEHQGSPVRGHFSDRCSTCTIASGYDAAAAKTGETLSNLFPSQQPEA
ncbi:MAG: hypothetical protein JWN82_460 [Candidatus Saccharibacteria bacterium]|nr:hypothetical protein [Candidatus Saccharibacteria bacterium]